MMLIGGGRSIRSMAARIPTRSILGNRAAIVLAEAGDSAAVARLCPAKGGILKYRKRYRTTATYDVGNSAQQTEGRAAISRPAVLAPIFWMRATHIDTQATLSIAGTVSFLPFMNSGTAARNGDAACLKTLRLEGRHYYRRQRHPTF
jgi:hypothetical protein